ncbi:hypothetical protein ACFLQI_03510 [Candidatus Undinarchaeota archaeon]
MPDPTGLLIGWSLGGLAIILALGSVAISLSLDFGGRIGKAWKLFAYSLLLAVAYVSTGAAIVSEWLSLNILTAIFLAATGLAFGIFVCYGFHLLSDI